MMDFSEEVYVDISEESLIRCVKKSFNFALPIAQSSQFDKNPFQRTPGPKSKAKSVSALNLSKKAIQIAPMNSKHKSCVIGKEYRVRGNLEKLPKPVCSTSEADEPEEILSDELNKLGKSTLTSSVLKNVIMSQETTTCKAKGIYKMRLTGEAIYNFRELQQVEVPSKEEIGRRTILLPEPARQRKSNKTLFVDLDETLVHTMQTELDYSLVPIDPRAVQTTTFLLANTGKLLNLKTVFRPHVREFLKRLSATYEIVVFTAGARTYAETIINLIDPEKEFIDYKLYRENCIPKGNALVKDLRVISNRDMKNMVIIDNAITSFASHLNNGIHITSFFGSEDDTELLKVLPLLEMLANVENVQTELEEQIGLKSLYEEFVEGRN